MVIENDFAQIKPDRTSVIHSRLWKVPVCLQNVNQESKKMFVSDHTHATFVLLELRPKAQLVSTNYLT